MTRLRGRFDSRTGVIYDYGFEHMRMGVTALLVVSVVCPACQAHSLTRAQASPAQDETVLQGVLTSIWGDPQAGGPRLLLHLTDTAGTTVSLQIPESVLEAAGGLRALSGRQVVVTTARRQAGSTSVDPAVEVRAIRLATADEIQKN